MDGLNLVNWRTHKLNRVFTHHVLDFEGETLMRFQSKKEAEWFCADKPECKIIQVATRPRTAKPESVIDWNNKEDECLL